MPWEPRTTKAVLRRIFDDVINRKTLDLADELYAAEHELHPDAGVGRGPEGMKQAFAGLHEEFPDIHVQIESIVEEGDMVAVRVTFRGTHAPTGEPAVWPEMVFTRFADGKAVESWAVTDTGAAGPALRGRRAAAGAGSRPGGAVPQRSSSGARAATPDYRRFS